jgi:hypothetical protein
MGRLFYGNTSDPIDIPDGLLAHVKVVAATKLRRSESFTLSWAHPRGSAPGRTTLWMQPSIPLRFVFDNAETESLDAELLKRLAAAANTSAGLTLEFESVSEDSHLSLVSAA